MSDEEEGELGAEELANGEEEVIEDNPLSKEVVGDSLSLLCKTGNGLQHAYVRMDLRDKGLTDISILECFVHIRYMDISGNALQDISALSSLPHLLTIKADHNRLSAVRLRELQYLQVASFANNRLTSTEGIAHPLLENLNLASNQITELAGLSDQCLPSLKVLDLHANQLSSTLGIHTTSLQKLYLARNKLTSLEGLESLRQLTTLHLRNNQVTSLNGFAPSMEALQYLNLRANAVAEMDEIAKLKSLPFLRALILAECPISEVDDYRTEVLVSLRKLERLDKDEFTEEERADVEDIHQQRERGGGGAQEED